MKEFIQEFGLIILALLMTSLTAILGKVKLSIKNNKMLKIIDTLMIIAEYTGLNGEDKKTFVTKIFNDFKIGKVDNISDYIDDKINLSKNVNVNKELFLKVQKESKLIEEINKIDDKDKEINYLKDLLSLRNKQIDELRRKYTSQE